jgi:ABC-type nitrate/sulfonate/bicarbonate transport system substrate-binding protein
MKVQPRRSAPGNLVSLCGLALAWLLACAPPPGAGISSQPAAGIQTPPVASAPGPLKPLKIQVSNKSAAFTFLYVTKDLGLFAQHGFDAEIIPMSSTAAVAALQAGEIDFMAAVGSATRAALRGVPIRVVLVASTSPDQVLVGAKGTTSVEQLRGKVVAGLAPQNNVNAILVELLRRLGLGAGQYEILNAGPGPARAAALTNGLAAATLLDSTDALVLQREGYPELDRASGKVELIYSGLAASQAALQNNREAVRQALRAVLQGVEVTRTQIDRVLPIMAAEFELSLDDAALVYPTLQPGLTRDGKPSPAAVQFEFEMDQREMELPEPIRHEQVFDFSLLDEIAARR